MTCRKARKLMPLAAGGDLRPREAAALLAHAGACPACREELEAFRAALAGIKAATKAESAGDWSEGEWSALMARVAAAPERAARPAFEARWAAAAGAFLGLVVLGLLFRGPDPGPGGGFSGGGRTGEEPEAAREVAAMALAAVPALQESVTITMVSPETGLQVVWFLDKNFDYEGERE